MLVAVPIFGMAAALPVARSESFRRSTRNGWYGSGDVAFTTRDTSCDILIFGDSTAVTGLNARLIEQETHLRTCNIAQSLGVLSVVGLTPLDRFLQHNPRPEYLVIQFGADDLAPFDGQWSDGYVEGVYDLIEFFPPSVTLREMTAHPDSFVALARAVATLGGQAVLRAVRHTSGAASAPTRAEDRPDVFFTVPAPPRTACVAADDARPLRLPSAHWLETLRSRYGRSAEHLLLEIAPTPDCDARYPAARSAVAGWTDNEYERYPIQMYNDRFVHFTAEGAARLSAALARQIASSQRSGAVGLGSRAEPARP